jgi:hypothetical protein
VSFALLTICTASVCACICVCVHVVLRATQATETLLPSPGATAPAAPSVAAVFWRHLVESTLYVVIFFYTTTAQHAFSGFQCSNKDACNPIRCVYVLVGRTAAGNSVSPSCCRCSRGSFPACAFDVFPPGLVA